MSKETMSFRVETFSNWQSFLEKAQLLLLESEAESNLIWEVGRVSAQNTSSARPWSGWLVVGNGKPLLAALPSVTGYLILSAGKDSACPALVDHLSALDISLNGVSGPETVASSFAGVWQDTVGVSVKLGASLSFYSASTNAEHKNSQQGFFRRACPQEGELLRGWAIDFGAESPRPMDPRSLTRLSEHMLGQGNLFVWEENEEIRAMGGFGRETPNGLVINMVFTPKSYRGRGFASALTASLVREAGRRGKEFCCLYSEFRSSTRPNLYEQINFRLAGEFTERAFRA